MDDLLRRAGRYSEGGKGTKVVEVADGALLGHGGRVRIRCQAAAYHADQVSSSGLNDRSCRGLASSGAIKRLARDVIPHRRLAAILDDLKFDAVLLRDRLDEDVRRRAHAI